MAALQDTESSLQGTKSSLQGTESSLHLIDGFPRNMDNLTTWLETTSMHPKLVIELHAAEEVLLARLLSRQEGRSDDNEATVRKRFEVRALAPPCCVLSTESSYC